MRLRLLFSICCVFVVTVNHCQSLKRCGTDEYYVTRRNGKIKCKSCSVCSGGGIGYNTSVVREEDEYGYKTCYPCEQCAEGTYRTLKSHSSYCYLCMLDCARTLRYESVSCGGDTEGHCGDCLAGLKPESSEPNSMCFPDPVVANLTPKPKHKPDVDKADKSINEDQMNPTDHMVKDDSEEKMDIKVLVIYASFVACMLICCVLYYCNQHVCKRRPSHTANGTVIHSKTKLLSISGESVRSVETGVPEKKGQLSEKPTVMFLTDENEVEGYEVGMPLLESKHDISGDNLAGNDLEVDSPEVVPADTPDGIVDDSGTGTSIVRGELQSHDDHIEGIGLRRVLNDNIPIAHENIPITRVGIQPVQDRLVTQDKTIKSHTYWFYNRSLQEDNETVTLAASRIHGENRHELFLSYMELSKPIISAYDEKWIRDSHNYPFQVYILDCLKHWLRKHGKEANLKWLLESLKRADYEDIAHDIVKLPENQLPENYPDNDVNVMCIDLNH